MVFYAAFNSISVILRRQFTLFMSVLGFTSTRLGSEVSCPRTLPRKNPEDLVRLEPRTPGLRVKHLTTEPRGTLKKTAEKFSKRVENTVGKGEIARYEQFLLFPTVFLKDMYYRRVNPGACLGKG